MNKLHRFFIIALIATFGIFLSIPPQVAHAVVPSATLAPATLAVGGFSAATASVMEGGTVLLTIILDTPANGTVSIDWATSDGTALQAVDYIAASGTLTFANGERTKGIVVKTIDDLLNEPPTTFSVILSNPINATLGLDTVVVTMNDNDPLPVVGFSIPINYVTEGAIGYVQVSLNKVYPLPVTVDWITFDMTAISGVDYTGGSGTLTFAPGESVKTIPIQTNDDTLYEPTRSLGVTLSAPTNAALGNPTYKLSILDNDPLPVVNIASASPGIVEGGTIKITINLRGAYPLATTMDWATKDGTALQAVDYLAASGTLTFAPGEKSKIITVATINNLIHDPARSFSVVLSNIANGTFGTSAVSIAINDNDPLPFVSLPTQSPVFIEGAKVDVVVSLSNTYGAPVSVNWTTRDLTAVAGQDYTAASGTLTFAAGEKYKTVSIQTIGDVLYEPMRTFKLVLSNPSNSILKTSIVTLIEKDDDPLPVASFAVASQSIVEGVRVDLVVNLSNTYSLPASFDWTTKDLSAIAGVDYTGDSGTLTFAPGEKSKVISVQTINDTTYDPTRIFSVALTNPVNGLLGQSNTMITEKDNDPLPVASIANPSPILMEGDSVDLVINLSSPYSLPTSFSWTTWDGTALAGVDYTAAAGTLTFAAGEQSKTITIQTLNDSTFDPTRKFTVALSNPVNGLLGSVSSATITEKDDDALPIATFSPVTTTLFEGDTASLIVNLNTTYTLPVTLSWSTRDGTAFSGTDYVADSGTITFAAGETSKTIAISTLDDTFYNPTRTFTVVLMNPINAVIGTPTATITEKDNDPLPTVNFTPASSTITEGVTLNLTIALSNPYAAPVTLNWYTRDGTAKAGTDYTAAAGMLNFAVGETTKTITISTINDMLYDPTRTFTVLLASPINAVLGNSTYTVNLLDDDPIPTASFTVTNNTTVEGGQVNLTIVLTNAYAAPASLTWATRDGTALSSRDYVAASGKLTYAIGETSKTISISTIDDSLFEGNRSFNIILSTPVNLTLGTTTAMINLQDNDTLPVAGIAPGSLTVVEGNSFNLTVSLDHSYALPVYVPWSTADGSAMAYVNYKSANGTLTFAVGETSKTITIQTLWDKTSMVDRTFEVRLAKPVNGVLGASGTEKSVITDQDIDAPLTVNFTTGWFYSPETGTAQITATLSKASIQLVSVNYLTAGSTAIAGLDYVDTTGTLTFAPGETSHTFNVTVINNARIDGARTVWLYLTGPSAGLTVGTPMARLTIQDNDSLVGFSTDLKTTDGGVTYSLATGSFSATITGQAQDGTLSLTETQSAPAIWPGYKAMGPYFILSLKDAAGNPIGMGQATVCFPYLDSDLQSAGVLETSLHVLQFDGANWVEVTVSQDVTLKQICGQGSSLSTFVIAGQ